ncbi:MAG TPA: hypothetical protein VFX16_31790 [Pseudonocardiaceae bacterium]|nr:hypothetical protein [Pseudonocardiaceae bacterium]
MFRNRLACRGDEPTSGATSRSVSNSSSSSRSAVTPSRLGSIIGSETLLVSGDAQTTDWLDMTLAPGRSAACCSVGSVG